MVKRSRIAIIFSFLALSLIFSGLDPCYALTSQVSVTVTDNTYTVEDLSGGEDIDAPTKRELVVRWTHPFEDVKNVHVYVLVNQTGRPVYLGQTGDDTSYFVWKEGVRFLSAPFKDGPQDGKSYIFYVYFIRRGAPNTGPFSSGEQVLFTVDETLPPSPEDMVCVEMPEESVEGVPMLELWPFEIYEGDSLGLNVVDCSGDEGLDIQVPTTNSENPATIAIMDNVCEESGPKSVKIRLVVGFDETDVLNSAEKSVRFDAYSETDEIVDSAIATSSLDEQDIWLASEEGIHTITMEGSDFCMADLCWSCNEAYKPEPEEPTIIVTDDLDSTEDLSNSYDEDSPYDRELTIKWDMNIPNVKMYHIYVLEVGEAFLPKYLGRTQDGNTNYFQWREGTRYLSGNFKHGPQDGKTYQFYVFALIQGAKNEGPFQNAGPVEYIVDDSIVLPSTNVIVTDDDESTEDLSNHYDEDSPLDRELTIQWDLGLQNVRMYHLYVLDVGNADKPKYLGHTKDGNTNLFQWREGTRYLSGEFKYGPQFGKSYQFYVYAILSGAPYAGPFQNAGPVEFKLDESVVIPSTNVIVTDDLESSVDLSNSYDEDPASNRALVIQWDLDVDDVKSYHIYVLDVGNMNAPQYLGRTKDGETTYFEWREGTRFLDNKFRQGPQFGKSYQFTVFAIPKKGAKVGPFPNAGPVEFKEESSGSTNALNSVPVLTVPLTPTPTVTPTPVATATPTATPTPVR